MLPETFQNTVSKIYLLPNKEFTFNTMLTKSMAEEARLDLNVPYSKINGMHSSSALNNKLKVNKDYTDKKIKSVSKTIKCYKCIRPGHTALNCKD